MLPYETQHEQELNFGTQKWNVVTLYKYKTDQYCFDTNIYYRYCFHSRQSQNERNENKKEDVSNYLETQLVSFMAHE